MVHPSLYIGGRGAVCCPLEGNFSKNREKTRPPDRARVFGQLLHQLDDGHLGGVAAAGAHLQHPGVAAVAVGVLGADLVEQLLGHVLLGDVSQHLPVGGQVVLLRQGNHLLGDGSNLLRAGLNYVYKDGAMSIVYRIQRKRIPIQLKDSRIITSKYKRFIYSIKIYRRKRSDNFHDKINVVFR